MKRVFFTILSSLCMLLSMQSCTKSPTEIVVPGSVIDDTTWASVDTIPKVTDSLDKPVVIDSFNCAISNNNANNINIGDSVMINFPEGGCMTAANQPSTTIRKSTRIKAEIRIYASKGDLIRVHASSVSNGNLIVPGAFINIKLSYKGKEIFWNPFTQPIQVRIRAANTTQPMTYFAFQYNKLFGKDSSWLSGSLSSAFGYVIPYKDAQKRTGYQIYTNRPRLFGCAYYLDKDSLLPKTRLNVFLPLKYTNTNTLVYAALDNYKTVVRLKPNPVGKSYGVTGIPINSKVTLISLSKIKGIYYQGISAVTVVDSKPFTVIPTQTDIKSIDYYLKHL